MLSEAGKRWCRRAALTEENPYEVAQLLYIFFGEKPPYTWQEITKLWPLFRS